MLYSFPADLLWNTCACCNWRHRRRKCPTIQQKNEWKQKWPYKKNALARGSTLCVAGALIGWLCQIQNLYHWPQSKHLQRLSPHGLHWPTVDEGLDTAALTSVSLMLLGRRNATTGGSGNNLASVSLFSRRSCPWVKTLCRRGTHWKTLADPKFILLTAIQVGKKIKDRKKRVFGSASYKRYTRFKYIAH
jgi:hypothetical protein